MLDYTITSCEDIAVGVDSSEYVDTPCDVVLQSSVECILLQLQITNFVYLSAKAY